jgi:hypothetical protein
VPQAVWEPAKQAWGPEFKPQYHPKKKKKLKTLLKVME